jgi:hypothetical protein
MLAAGQIDAALGFRSGSMSISRTEAPLDDIVLMPMADYG